MHTEDHIHPPNHTRFTISVHSVSLKNKELCLEAECSVTLLIINNSEKHKLVWSHIMNTFQICLGGFNKAYVKFDINEMIALHKIDNKATRH